MQPCAPGCSQHITAPDMLGPAIATLLGSSLTGAAPFGHPLVSAAYFGTCKWWFRFASINILPSLSAWLSSHLMLGWCQVRLQEGEDDLAAAQGLQPQ